MSTAIYDRLRSQVGRGPMGRIDDRALIVVVLVLLTAALAIFFVEGFGNVDNGLVLLRLSAALGILAVGSAIVIIGGGLDLSAAAVVAVAAQSTVALFDDNGFSELSAIAVVLIAAVVMGTVNGVLVAYVEVPALFVTLATWQLFSGVTDLVLLDSDNYFLPASSTFVDYVGRGELVGIPVPILMFGAVAAGAAFFLSQTSYGRMVRAIGDNQAAARMAGLPVRPVVALTFVLAAICGCLAGLVTLGSTGGYSTSNGAGTSILFDAIAIAVIGGVSLSGGRGSISGVVAATVLIALTVNIMTLLDFSIVQRTLTKAFILLIALVLDAALHPTDEETSRSGEL